jgi:hypothetical protein
MTDKTLKTVKKTDKLPWPFPVVNGERTESSKALIAASKKLQRPLRGQLKQDACEDMPEALF